MSSDEQPLILASASPRRRELLGYLGVSFKCVSNLGEERDMHTPPVVLRALPAYPLDRATHPTLLAWRKAHTAVEEGSQGLILGADTIVVIDGEILGKPRNPAEARQMLRRLAGRTHTVYTGVVLLETGREQRFLMDLVRSDVAMSPLDDHEIAEYVATGEPLDKAGAYGIQGLGGRLVQSVEGSYTAVVGLPLASVYDLLAAMGVKQLVEPAEAFRRWLVDQGRDVPSCTAP